MRLFKNNYWSVIIDILLQKYFSNLTTTCVLWSQNFKFDLRASANSTTVLLQINPLGLNESFGQDVYDFSAREDRDNKNNVYYDDLVKKLIAAIENAHCEGFLAFQDDIPRFAQAFRKACAFAIWRSINNRFLFAYSKDEENKDYFQDLLFKDQANIFVVEAECFNCSVFHLKTNKFVGPTSQFPQELVYLSSFYASNLSFVPNRNLYSSEKLLNLQGREIIVGVFDYRPFVAVDFERLPQYYDQAPDNPSHLVHVDGTEIRISHTFCEMYNCTLQFDTSEKGEWGLAFSNYSGYGLIGMIIEGKIHMAMDAMYALRSDYTTIDITTFIGRSGVTCLVPVASSLATWNLPLRPFKFALWLAVLGCLLLETLLLFAARKFEHSLSDSHDTWWSCLKFSYITTLKLFVNQNTHYLVQSHTVRTSLFACYVIDIILTSVYGGGLAAVLTLPTFAQSADSVEGLYKFNLTWTASSLAWLESINETQANEQSIYKRLIDNFQVNSMDEMRSKAKTENMAFVLERLAFGHFGGGDYISPEALKRLKLMLDDIYFQYTVAMVSRLWVHLPKYNDLLLMWHSAGLGKFWEWKITAEYLNVNEQNQVEASKYNNFDVGPTKLNAQNFAGLIILWIVGMVVSVGAFVGELVWFNWGQRKRDNNKWAQRRDKI